MARIIAVVLVTALLAGAAQTMAAEESAHTCALTRAFQCTPEDGCIEVTLLEMEIPRFVRIDLKGKSISSLDREIKRNTKIERIDRQENVTILHGTDLRGWSITLARETGNLTLSASGEEEGFVLFGTCLP